VAFSPTKPIFASASYDGKVGLWDASRKPPKKVASVKGHEGAVHTLIFSLDGEFLVSGCECGTVFVWNVDGTSLTTRIKARSSQSAWSTAFSFEKMMIARSVGLYAHQILFHDVSGGTAIFKGATQVYSDESHCLAFSPDNITLACACSDSKIRLLDVSGSVPGGEHVLEGHSGAVSCVVFTSDNKILASAADDGTINLWDRKTGSLLHTVRAGHNSPVNYLAFSPNNEILASASDDDTIKLWEVSKGTLRELDTLSATSGHVSENSVYSVSFSFDSRAVIAGTDEGRVVIWERA